MSILIFKYDEMDGTALSNVSTDILTVEINSEPGCVVADVGNLLGFINSREALSFLDANKKQSSVIFRIGQKSSASLLSYSDSVNL